MSKVMMVVKSKAQPGKRAAVHDLWLKHLQSAAEANSNQELILYSFDTNDPDTFYLVELYSSQSAMEQNGQNPAFWAYMQEAMPLLDGQPEVMLATPAWTKGITV